VASVSNPPFGSSLLERFLDLGTPMHQFGGKNDLPALVIDKSDASRAAARIKFEPEGLHLWLFNRTVKNQREGSAS
jgi:hypothetical protein